MNAHPQAVDMQALSQAIKDNSDNYDRAVNANHPLANHIHHMDKTLDHLEQQFSAPRDLEGMEAYYEEACLNKDKQICALKALVDELSRKLFETNPDANITFNIADFSYSYLFEPSTAG